MAKEWTIKIERWKRGNEFIATPSNQEAMSSTREIMANDVLKVVAKSDYDALKDLVRKKEIEIRLMERNEDKAMKFDKAIHLIRYLAKRVTMEKTDVQDLCRNLLKDLGE